jgi:cystine transport system substrate-binding protein
MIGFLLAALVPVALGADVSGLRSQAAALRSDGHSLDARAKASTLELYALEAKLGRARAALDTLEARRSALARERTVVQTQLRIARKAVRSTERRLSELVRALYEQPDQGDPLAILLGADSIDEALAALDGLSRAADESSSIIEQARKARTRLGALSERLAAREAELEQLAAAAEARAAQLSAAGASRRAFVAELRRRQSMNAARVAAIEATAQQAGRRTQTLAASDAPVAAAPVEPASTGMDDELGGRTLTVSSTGYTLEGQTSTGVDTSPGVVAVDPSVIPLGTRITIPGYGTGIAADTGGSVHGSMIDLWFPTHEGALAWGRRTVTITLG